MNLPKLNPVKRAREYSNYTIEERDNVIVGYLFRGLSHRDLDKNILKFDNSRGWQSMGILHHVGLNGDFKGIFKGMSYTDVINELLKEKVENYNTILECITRYRANKIEIGKFDSWEILSNKLAIKTTDKSVFEHHASGIPISTRDFWGIGDLLEGQRYCIKLLFQDVEYPAHLQREGNEPYRTRLFWHSDLSEKIREFFPDYKDFEKEKENYPLMRFEKIKEDIYKINFIDIKNIGDDLEYDTDETITLSNVVGNNEGKLSYFYSKKYERNSKNRIDAIKIHGIRCLCCGFDFEKTYGKRGAGYIEIHHKTPLCSLNEEVVINPSEDLVPVCSNCHRMIHRRKDNVLTVEKIKELIKRN